jgi:hypothetical protein
MSDLYMVINGSLPVMVDYDYDHSEDTVNVNSVYIDDYTDIVDMLKNEVIDSIVAYIFDRFDKELQEPERE